MVKDKLVGVRVDVEEKKQMIKEQKRLKFNTLSDFLMFLWRKHQIERN